MAEVRRWAATLGPTKSVELALGPEFSSEAKASQRYNRQISDALALHKAIASVAPALRGLLSRNRDLLSVCLGTRVAARLRPSPEDLGGLFALVDRLNALTHLQIVLYPSADGTVTLAEARALATVLNARRGPGKKPVDALGAANLVPLVELEGGAIIREILRNGVADLRLEASSREIFHEIEAGRLPSRKAWVGQVRHIAMLTCNRPELLEPNLRSYLDNLKEYGRSEVGVVVFDDSSSTNADRNKAIVSRLEGEGFNVQYFGPDEKTLARRHLEHRLRDADRDKVSVSLLDRMLGFHDENGTWHGSTASQRNWISLLFAGRRILSVDDDTQPKVLDASDAQVRHNGRCLAAERDVLRQVLSQPVVDAQPYGIKGSLANSGALAPEGEDSVLENMIHRFASDWSDPVPFPEFLARKAFRRDPQEHALRSVDVVGIAESFDNTPVAARFSGHQDVAAAQVIRSFVNRDRETRDALEGNIDKGSVDRDEYPLRHRDFFRGSMFAGSSSLDGIDVCIPGRNQDYTLKLSRLITSNRRISPRGDPNFAHYHERGPRHTNQPRAAIEEAVMNEVNVMIAELARRCQLGTPNFSLESFLATSEDELSKVAAALTPERNERLSRTLQRLTDELPRIERKIGRLETLRQKIDVGMASSSLRSAPEAPGQELVGDYVSWYYDLFCDWILPPAYHDIRDYKSLADAWRDGESASEAVMEKCSRSRTFLSRFDEGQAEFARLKGLDLAARRAEVLRLDDEIEALLRKDSRTPWSELRAIVDDSYVHPAKVAKLARLDPDSATEEEKHEAIEAYSRETAHTSHAKAPNIEDLVAWARGELARRLARVPPEILPDLASFREEVSSLRDRSIQLRTEIQEALAGRPDVTPEAQLNDTVTAMGERAIAQASDLLAMIRAMYVLQANLDALEEQ